MDRETILSNLKQARSCASEVEQHIWIMMVDIMQGRGMPQAERSMVAAKLNRAAELIRRTHED